jgi:hypothetical protein
MNYTTRNAAVSCRASRQQSFAPHKWQTPHTEFQNYEISTAANFFKSPKNRTRTQKMWQRPTHTHHILSGLEAIPRVSGRIVSRIDTLSRVKAQSTAFELIPGRLHFENFVPKSF